jgi:MerR family transcriptional regulator, light-induced transcriptional regulator
LDNRVKNNLGTFSIKDIEAVSGIKCHTLRVWEQRYNIFTPKRTETNIRYYDDDDLKLILNISILNKYGYKISEISKMTNAEISEAILKISENKNEFSSQINGLVQNMMTFDEKAFHKILTTNIKEFGLKKVFLQIIFPFMKEVGLLWQVGALQPSHEHFVSNIIKQKLFACIDECVADYAPNHKRFLLFLPEKEKHSLGLLFANFIIRKRGHEVLYLGQEVPTKNLKEIYHGHTPDYVFTILTSSNLDIDKQKFVNQLSENWKDAIILLSGVQFLGKDISFPANAKYIRSPEEFISLTENL